MSILVSINCITYNHEKYIGQAIESFLMQKTNFDYEIVIGEDCSTDNTRKVVQEYVDKYPNKITLVTSEKNLGFMRNEKQIHKASKGKYIAVCEGDDYWIDPYKLQKQVDYMEAHPNCTLCFHNADRVNTDRSKRNELMLDSSIESKKFSTEDMLNIGFIPTASKLYPKWVMDEAPEWYLNCIVGDFPNQIITTSRGYAYYINEEMSAYRVGVENSAMTQIVAKNKDSKEKKLRNPIGRLFILDNFNDFTEGKYINTIDKIRKKYEFDIIYIKGDYKKAKLDRYKEYYNKVSTKRKMLLWLNTYIPALYKIVEPEKAN